MKQTARIISTYSADVMGVCSALYELGGMVVMHDASGCNSTYTTHDEPRWFDMDSMIFISGLSEMEAIMGDDEKLIDDITETAAELHPKFIAIAGTPIPAMTGFDFEAVAAVVEQRTGIPTLGFATTGMNTYVHGASMALAGIADRFVTAHGDSASADSDTTPAGEDAPEESDTTAAVAAPADLDTTAIGAVPTDSAAMERGVTSADSDTTTESASYRPRKRTKINILGLTPLDFSLSGEDRSIKRWLQDENFDVVSTWAMGSTLEELSRAAEADVDLVVSAAGLGVAKVLYEKFGIPYVVGLPIGKAQSAMLADTLADMASGNTAIPGSGLKTLLKTAAEKAENTNKTNNAETAYKTNTAGNAETAYETNTEGKTAYELQMSDSGKRGAVKAGSDIEENNSIKPLNAAVIGEGITSRALAAAIELELGIPAKVLCATECPEDVSADILRESDRITPDEDDIIPELKGVEIVIADPMYRPIVPQEVKFVELPHEGFSGRLYRSEIPDLVKDFGMLREKLINSMNVR